MILISLETSLGTVLAWLTLAGVPTIVIALPTLTPEMLLRNRFKTMENAFHLNQSGNR